ncbi:MAG: helix-turn-helix domain-containing protein [Halobacterium sp.]
MFRAKLFVDLDCDCVLSEVTSRWDTTVTVTKEEVIDDEYIRFVVDAGERVAEFQAAFEAAEEVTDLERVDGTRLVLTKRSCGALPVIRANHGMLDGWDKVNGNQRVFEIVVFRRDDLRAIVDELGELGTVELGRLTPYERPDSLLSDRQAEVLEAALAAGYFEWPRETDADELAAELDITRATLLEHLRKAERTLLEDSLSKTARSNGTTPNERGFLLGAATDGGH